MSRTFRILLAAILLLAALPISVRAQTLQSLTIVVDTPTTAIYGHRPIEVVVRVINSGDVAQDFDGTVTIGGPAWSGESYPYSYSPNSNVYNLIGQFDYITFYWHGNIPAKGSAWIDIPTFTSNNLGVYQFVNAHVNGMDKNQTLTLVEGNEAPVGIFAFAPTPSPLTPGSYIGLELTLTAPLLTQFQAAGPITSSCGLNYLPTGFTGHYQRTYEKYLWYIQLPNQFTNSTCNITVRVYQLPGYDRTFTVSTTLDILRKKIYLPVIGKN